MPKFLLLGLLATLSGLGCARAADVVPGSLFTALNPDKNGVCTIDGLQLQVQHKSDRWAPAWQRDLKLDAGYPQVTAASQSVKGTFGTDSGPYAFTQDIKQIDADSVSYDASLAGTPTKGSRVLCLSI